MKRFIVITATLALLSSSALAVDEDRIAARGVSPPSSTANVKRCPDHKGWCVVPRGIHVRHRR